MRVRALIAALVTMVVVAPAVAEEARGTPEEAKALVKKAIDYFKANGQDKTMASLNDPKGAFIDRDLYVFVHDDTGLYFAIAPKPAFVGKNLSAVKDANGKLIVQEQIDKLKSAPSMWQEYDWQNPVTGKIEHKKTYCEKVERLHFCSGAYSG